MKLNYKIPKNWSDITLGQYIALKTLNDNKLKISQEEFLFNYISILLRIYLKDVREFPINKIQHIVRELQPFQDIQLTITPQRIFEYEDRFFVAEFSFENATFGQYIDLNMYKDLSDDYWEYAHKIASSFIREAYPKNKALLKAKRLLGYKPKLSDFLIEKYDSIKANANAEIYKSEMGMDLIYTALSFFLIWKEKSKTTMLDYSKKQEQEMITT